MPATHTPAPWTYGHDSGDVLFANGDDDWPLVATFWTNNALADQAHANGVLGAAAPDLLDALVDAHDALVSARATILKIQGSTNPARNAAIEAASAAVAKATAQ